MCVSVQYVCVGYAYRCFVRYQHNDKRCFESDHCACTGWPRERNGCGLDSGRNMGQGGVLVRVTSPSLPRFLARSSLRGRCCLLRYRILQNKSSCCLQGHRPVFCRISTDGIYSQLSCRQLAYLCPTFYSHSVHFARLSIENKQTKKKTYTHAEDLFLILHHI